jgi:hypothetical protein
MRFSLEQQVIIFLIIWVIGYSTVLQVYFKNAHETAVKEHKVQTQYLEEQLQLYKDENGKFIL